MKKRISMLLAAVMCLSLCACGGENSTVTYYNVGDTVSTDIFEFTLDAADFAVALHRTCDAFGNPEDNYFTPKEYDAKSDGNNPFVASKGNTLVAFTYSVSNLDRTSAEFPVDVDVKYDGNIYEKFSNFEIGVERVSEPQTYIDVDGSMKTQPANVWLRYPSENMLISANATESRKVYMEIEVEPTDLNDTFEMTFNVPNSDGENETFTYLVNPK